MTHRLRFALGDSVTTRFNVRLNLARARRRNPAQRQRSRVVLRCGCAGVGCVSPTCGYPIPQELWDHGVARRSALLLIRGPLLPGVMPMDEPAPTAFGAADAEQVSSCPGPVTEFVRSSWPADLHQLAGIRRAVREWLGPLPMTDTMRTDVVFAVSEAVSNAIEHAYPGTHADTATGPGRLDTVELTLWTEHDALCIDITDHGTWQPPTTEATGRGLGIPTIHRSIDSFVIHYDSRGTRVLLRHSLQAHAVTTTDLAHVPVTPVQLYDSGD